MENKLTHYVLAISIIAASMIGGYSFYITKSPKNEIRVVGYASKRFESDIVKWRITVARSAAMQTLGESYSIVSKEIDKVTSMLRSQNLKETEIGIQPPSAQPVYGQNGITGYRVVQSLYISSKDIDKVEKLALNPAKLFSTDVALDGSTLEYFSTDLAELKRALLGEATKDAQRRAEEIASTSSLRISTLSSARAGVFQITEPYSTEIRDYGMFNSASRVKDITVTVNAAYFAK